MDLIAQGSIAENFIEPSFELVETFNGYWNSVMPLGSKTSMAYPYPRLRAREKITSHFYISASAHLWLIPYSQNPRNSQLFLWFCSLGSAKPEPNLSANSAKLFLREP
jgi:hypothetical protein